jgi:hypothetical protein
VNLADLSETRDQPLACFLFSGGPPMKRSDLTCSFRIHSQPPNILRSTSLIPSTQVFLKVADKQYRQ